MGCRLKRPPVAGDLLQAADVLVYITWLGLSALGFGRIANVHRTTIQGLGLGQTFCSDLMADWDKKFVSAEHCSESCWLGNHSLDKSDSPLSNWLVGWLVCLFFRCR